MRGEVHVKPSPFDGLLGDRFFFFKDKEKGSRGRRTSASRLLK